MKNLNKTKLSLTCVVLVGVGVTSGRVVGPRRVVLYQVRKLLSGGEQRTRVPVENISMCKGDISCETIEFTGMIFGQQKDY